MNFGRFTVRFPALQKMDEIFRLFYCLNPGMKQKYFFLRVFVFLWKKKWNEMPLSKGQKKFNTTFSYKDSKFSDTLKSIRLI